MTETHRERCRVTAAPDEPFYDALLRAFATLLVRAPPGYQFRKLRVYYERDRGGRRASSRRIGLTAIFERTQDID